VYTVFWWGALMERPRCRWKDNIKMDLPEVGWGGVDCFAQAQDGEVASTCECGNDPLGSIKCGEFCE